MLTTPSLHNQHLDECRGKIHAHGYKATARESGVPETTVRRFAYGADILHRSTMKLLAWAFPVGIVSLESQREAFLAGAKWWEYKSTGGTMWQSDQKEAWAKACERYPKESQS